jgi:hypothetical protein
MSRRGNLSRLAMPVLLAAVACGSTAAPAPTPTPMAVLATTYTQLVAPANSSGGALTAALRAPGASMATTRPAFESYLAALTGLNTKLPRFEDEVSAAPRADVQQLRQGVATELGDVQSVLSATTQSDWLAAATRWTVDAKAFGSAAQLVRADLGLPPVTPRPPA